MIHEIAFSTDDAEYFIIFLPDFKEYMECMNEVDDTVTLFSTKNITLRCFCVKRDPDYTPNFHGNTMHRGEEFDFKVGIFTRGFTWNYEKTDRYVQTMISGIFSLLDDLQTEPWYGEVKNISFNLTREFGLYKQNKHSNLIVSYHKY